MIIENNFTDDEIQQVCGDCINYYDCHENGFDWKWAKCCYNIKYSDIENGIIDMKEVRRYENELV